MLLGEGELLLWAVTPIVSSYIIALVNLKGRGETPARGSIMDSINCLFSVAVSMGDAQYCGFVRMLEQAANDLYLMFSVVLYY